MFRADFIYTVLYIPSHNYVAFSFVGKYFYVDFSYRRILLVNVKPNLVIQGNCKM